MDLTQQQLSVVLDLLAANLGPLGLDVTLLDEAGAAVLHEESQSEHRLVLTIHNQGNHSVVIHKGEPRLSYESFSLTFKENVSFRFGSPPKVVSPGTWEAGYEVDSNQCLTRTFLASTQDHTLKPGAEIKIEMAYQMASACHDALTANVRVTATKHVTIASMLGTGHWDLKLRLVKGADLPNPLLAAVAGPRTVLNDGTKTSVKIFLTNPALVSLAYEKPANAGETTPTSFRVRVPLAKDPDFALCLADKAQNLSLTTQEVDPKKPKWKIDPQGPVTTEKTWVVRPVYENNPAFPAEGTLVLTLAGIESTLAPGVVGVLVDLVGFPRYGTQTRMVTLEKSPLIYRAAPQQGLLTAGTKGANTALEIQGDTTQPALAVTQKGTGPAAVFAGGKVEIAASVDRSAPKERLQVGSFEAQSDSYVAVRAAKGGGHKSGVKLEVAEGIGFTIENDDSSAGLNILRQNQPASPRESALFIQRINGNVGIGMTKPEARLHVVGDLRLESADKKYRTVFLREEPNLDQLEIRESGDLVFSPGAKAGSRPATVVMKGDGNVGIGTNTPQAKLHVVGDGKFNGIGANEIKAQSLSFPPVPDADKNAAVGFPADSKTKDFVVVTRAAGGLRLGGKKGVAFYNNLNDCLSEASAATKLPPAWLDEEGIFRVKTLKVETSYKGAGIALFGDGNLFASGNLTASGYVSAAGNVYAGGYLCCVWSGTWKYLNHDNNWTKTSGPSDRTLKKEIQPIEGALAKVQSLQGVRFRWNDRGIRHLTREADSYCAGPGATVEENEQVRQAKRTELARQLSDVQMGLIAQEVEAVAPEVVRQDGEGYLNVDYDRLVALLVEAVKEQKALFDEQAAEIRALRARLDALANGLA